MDWTELRSRLSDRTPRIRTFNRTYNIANINDDVEDPEQIKLEPTKSEQSTVSKDTTTSWDDLFRMIDNSQSTVQHPSTTTTSQVSTPSASVRTGSGPRGYRNNNPLNIRISNNPWKGKVSDNTDGSFEQFVDIAHGYRAGFINMRTQINRGNNTIRKLINIWAPASDSNNPENYAKFVSSTSGIPIDAVIDPNDAASMQKIVSAMARMENGKDANSDDIVQGWKLYTGTE